MPSTHQFSRRKAFMLVIFALFLLPILTRAALYTISNDPRSWRDADWSSTGMLPAASDFKPARVIVFTARAGDYRIWPGPNSNSFVATILRAVPELAVSLPPNAVGRDFRDGIYAGLT